MDEPGITDEFTMDCPTCGPSTVLFVCGEMVPHGCDYEPPSVVIDCSTTPEQGGSHE